MNQVIGLGTGRCGTQTLAMLLNGCDFRHSTHERAIQLPWKFDETLYQIRLNEFLVKPHEHDVALHYLPYISRFIKDLPELKVIALKRDKKEVINSFMQKTKGQKDWRVNFFKIWVQFFGGKIPLNMTQEEALSEYYNHYNSELNYLQEKYPKVVKIFDIDELNTNQKGIFEWAGVLKKDMRFQDSPRYNTIEEHIAYEQKYGKI